MREKINEKEKCIKLRKQGYSIRQIEKEVKVSKGSISLWVRDIKLTDEQMNILRNRRNKCDEKKEGYEKRSKNYRDRRLKFQEDGRKKARESDSYYALGCALFWGEGTKKKDILKITNCDPSMLKFFVLFLQKYFEVKPEEISINIQYYLNGNLSLNDIEKYWCEVLELPFSSLRKHTLKGKYYNYDISNIKYPYGICSLSVFSTEKVMQIYGSIKEYIGDNSDRWLW